MTHFDPVQRATRRLAFTAIVCLASSLKAQDAALAASVNTNNIYLIDLPTVLRLANAQNLDVQIARERLTEAKANHDSAVEQFFPWIFPGAAWQRHKGEIQAVDGTMLDVTKQSYTAGGTLSAQIDLGDAIYQSLAAKQLVKAAGHALESQQQDTTFAAAQGYYDLAKAKAIARVFTEALNISSNYQAQLHEAVGAGIAFKGDELRVQVQTERYQITLRQSLEQQRVAAARLAQILHLDPSVELMPQDADLVPLTLIATNAALDSLVKNALNSRPELKQNQALTSAACDAKNEAVYGPIIPTLGAQAFVGGLGGGKNDNTGNFAGSEDYFVGLGWKIGPGGLFDVGRIRSNKARFETARLNGEKVRDQITREVVENNTRAQSLFEQLATTKQNLSTAAETLRLTQARKEFGVGAVLEDIQSQQELTHARSDYLNTVVEYDKAEYGLKRAIGDLTAR